MALPQRTARIAGLLYILIALISPIGILLIPSRLINWEDATATANNIMSSILLYRFGLMADAITILLEIVLLVLLFLLFKPVSHSLSLIAAFSRLSMTIIQSVNLLVGCIVLVLISGAGFLAAFDSNQLNSLIMLCLKTRDYGIYVWQIFFAFHLIFLGYLVFKSGYLPKLLGILLMLGCFGYLFDSIQHLLLDTRLIEVSAAVFLTIGVIGELSLALWLLIKGVNLNNYTARLATLKE